MVQYENLNMLEDDIRSGPSEPVPWDQGWMKKCRSPWPGRPCLPCLFSLTSIFLVPIIQSGLPILLERVKQNLHSCKVEDSRKTAKNESTEYAKQNPISHTNTFSQTYKSTHTKQPKKKPTTKTTGPHLLPQKALRDGSRVRHQRSQARLRVPRHVPAAVLFHHHLFFVRRGFRSGIVLRKARVVRRGLDSYPGDARAHGQQQTRVLARPASDL